MLQNGRAAELNAVERFDSRNEVVVVVVVVVAVAVAAEGGQTEGVTMLVVTSRVR